MHVLACKMPTALPGTCSALCSTALATCVTCKRTVPASLKAFVGVPFSHSTTYMRA